MAEPEIKQDRDAVLAAVSVNGLAIRSVAPELIDREIVLAAVRQFGLALSFVAPELQKDREIVLAAVQQYGWALRYAAPELQQDRDIALAAVQCNPGAIKFVDESLAADSTFLLDAVLVSDGVRWLISKEQYAILTTAEAQGQAQPELCFDKAKIERSVLAAVVAAKPLSSARIESRWLS